MHGPKKTGTLCAASLKYIKAAKPRLALFENVPTLKHKKHIGFTNGMLKYLKDAGYNVFDKVLNTKSYGLPQDRQRLYIVAIRNDTYVKQRPFTWPAESRPVGMNTVLDPQIATDKAGRLPTLQMSKDRCVEAYKACHAKGIDPRTNIVMVDIDAGKQFSTYGVNECKTLTRSRGGSGGPWVSTRGRRLTTNELLKVQGSKHSDCLCKEQGARHQHTPSGDDGGKRCERARVRPHPHASLVEFGADQGQERVPHGLPPLVSSHW